MKKKRAALVLLILVIVVIVALAWIREKPPEKYAGSVEKIRFTVATPDSSALIYIADSRGFFRDRGLDVSIKPYEAGVLAVNDLAADETDIATISEFVLVGQILKGTDLKAFGTTVIANSSELIGRKDRGIEKASDLKGKKIGRVGGSGSEFFLETFLASHGIQRNDVKVVNLKPTQLVDAILTGRIDAAASFFPFGDTIRTGLGTNAVAWPLQGKQDYYMLLVAKPSFIKTRSAAIERLLTALIDAEKFLEAHEAEAWKIVAERSNVDPSSLLSLWPKSRFEVRLDQDLLILMEFETRWAMRNKLTGGTRLPNYFDFIYIDALEKINPQAVSIIH